MGPEYPSICNCRKVRISALRSHGQQKSNMPKPRKPRRYEWETLTEFDRKNLFLLSFFFKTENILLTKPLIILSFSRANKHSVAYTNKKFASNSSNPLVILLKRLKSGAD